MRECHRVLRPGGRLAALSIEPAAGLSERERARAVEIGPSHLSGDDSVERASRAAGFRLHDVVDVTEEFRRVALEAIAALERVGAQPEPDFTADEWAGEMDRKSRMVRGVEEGVLVRTLVLGERI